MCCLQAHIRWSHGSFPQDHDRPGIYLNFLPDTQTVLLFNVDNLSFCIGLAALTLPGRPQTTLWPSQLPSGSRPPTIRRTIRQRSTYSNALLIERLSID